MLKHNLLPPESRKQTMETVYASTAAPPQSWQSLAGRVLDGHSLTEAEGLAILRSDDVELLDLMAAAYRVRHRHFGNQVQMNFLVNAKSGLCGEDCGYCSQSKVSTAAIPRYSLLGVDEVVDGARLAVERGARTYCIVTAGRSPTRCELDWLLEVVPRVKEATALRVCVSPGLLDAEQARKLKSCGVDRVNHNLNTSERYYPKICTTHGYQDRLATLRAARDAGLELCCGGIVGMGEEDADVVELALRVGRLRAEAVPVNFLLPIEGTPVAPRPLDPRYCLKVLALFRLANPQGELRIAAGREVHLRSLQPLGLYAANSIFVGDYLTEKGQPPQQDYQMIEDLGFEMVLEGKI
jgi:biotin synthase